MSNTETLNQNNNAPVEEAPVEEEAPKKKRTFFSWPLFQQSVKSTWLLWLLLAVGAAAIFVIINLVVGTKKIFTNIDMNAVTTYVSDENLSWLKLLGFLETMGFSLNRIQTMSQIDMNSVMNDLIYKIAGVLLPMVYVMIVANKLIAAQVSDGSMAYILSTPTNRKKVLRTQYLFLISSLFAMYLVITTGALVSEGIANIVLRNSGVEVPPVGYRLMRTTLYCFGSFMAIFGLSGICFGASAWFNKSNQSIALGGGVSILCFLACVLGLFGNKVFVAVGVGVKAMDFFNYLTLFTLIDTETMNLTCKSLFTEYYPNVAADFTWLWKLAILFVIGVAGALIGSIKFVKKDLPL